LNRHRPPSLYEGWLLKPTTNKGEPALILFCGLKIRFYPPTNSPFYNITPFSLEDEMLKKRAELVNTKFKEVSKQGGEIPNTIEQEIATLPEKVKLEVDELLEDRNHDVTRGYGWKVLSIETLSKKSRKSFFTRKSTPSSPPNWLIILRGGEATNIKKEHATKIFGTSHYSGHSAPQRRGYGADGSPFANAAPSPTSTDSSFTSFLNPTGRTYSAQPPRERSYGASSMERKPPMNAYQLVKHMNSNLPSRPVVVEPSMMMGRVLGRQSSLEPRASDAYDGDEYFRRSTEPDSARGAENDLDVERLMDQFLKTFVEDGEGDNE
jgi:hypothetical protein